MNTYKNTNNFVKLPSFPVWIICWKYIFRGSEESEISRLKASEYTSNEKTFYAGMSDRQKHFFNLGMYTEFLHSTSHFLSFLKTDIYVSYCFTNLSCCKLCEYVSLCLLQHAWLGAACKTLQAFGLCTVFLPSVINDSKMCEHLFCCYGTYCGIIFFWFTQFTNQTLR